MCAMHIIQKCKRIYIPTCINTNTKTHKVKHRHAARLRVLFASLFGIRISQSNSWQCSRVWLERKKCVYVFIHVNEFIHMRVHVHILIPIYIRTHIHILLHIHIIYIYTPICIYINTMSREMRITANLQNLENVFINLIEFVLLFTLCTQ